MNLDNETALSRPGNLPLVYAICIDVRSKHGALPRLGSMRPMQGNR